jgi:divalent metal cation (Fe/Co/Zn/Cd) transporter
MPEVLYHHDVKIRTAGADIFIDLNIHVERNITVEDAHDIAERLKMPFQEALPVAMSWCI